MAVTATTTERWVVRPRLSALLDAKPWARLALVSAPAGFGKTTAVAAWSSSSHVRAATVLLQRTDNDTVRFLRALARALESSSETSGAGPQIGEDDDASAAAVVEWLRLASHAAPERRVALALDDYHLIDDPRIHRIVATVIDRLPERGLVVIATRADPPIPLARLRARDELVEVRAADLRFSSEEAAELLRMSGVELDAGELDELTSRTEGWAAVLRLAAIALRGRADAGDAVRRFGASHRFVLDYVVEEVLGGLPSETVGFLLRTSILERLCGELCDAVTDGIRGQQTLERLERDNLLLLPLDDERRWFRYHALFAAILRGRLRAELPDTVPILEARASRWFEAHELADEAIAHALAAGDVDRAGRLVADASLRWLNGGELATVRGWLDALGPEAVRGMAQLSLSSAWCLSLGGQLDEAERQIADAEAAHAAGSDGGPFSAAMVPAELALLRAFIAGVRGDSTTAIAEATAARQLVPAGLPPVAEATLRGDATVFLARALLVAGDTERGFESYLAALPDLRAGRNVLALGRAMNDLVVASIEHGDPAGGLRLCDEELDRTPGIARSAAYWGAVAKAREAIGDERGALGAARRALELAVRAGDGQVTSWAREAEARLGQHAGIAAGAVRPSERLVEPLTDRELEVLRLVAEGHSNRQIAQGLFVTVGTVKSHVHAISGKLGATSRGEAVALARRQHLID